MRNDPTPSNLSLFKAEVPSESNITTKFELQKYEINKLRCAPKKKEVQPLVLIPLTLD
jgi:hypothetical protein